MLCQKSIDSSPFPCYIMNLRAKLGPDVPIVIALDMRANIVAEMVENVNAMVAYHTAPHTDAYETGVRAAEVLLQNLREGVQTRVGFAKIPFLLPGGDGEDRPRPDGIDKRRSLRQHRKAERTDRARRDRHSEPTGEHPEPVEGCG
jgi:microcystin degradation protein MlrC